jgi:putative oxidoreductase
MRLVRSIARPLLASTFIVGGFDALTASRSKVPAAEKVVAPVVEKLPHISSTEQVVQLDAAVKIVAGTLLAFGRFPRLSALALAASLVPTTFAGHRFWEESDPAKRTQQRLHFLKNASMLGGVMLAAVDTEGRPSLSWRARRAPHAIGHVAADLRRETEHALQHAADTVREKLPT